VRTGPPPPVARHARPGSRPISRAGVAGLVVERGIARAAVEVPRA